MKFFLLVCIYYFINRSQGLRHFAHNRNVQRLMHTGTTLDDNVLDRMLQVAEIAARQAGLLINQNMGAVSRGQKLNFKDIVTKIDLDAQAVIEEIICESYPLHGFLGEENVLPGSTESKDALELALGDTGSEIVWIVDPIDGTTNFAAGLPLCAISIAAAYRNSSILAVIYDPFSDDMYTAISGRGAFCNGERICCKTCPLSDAVINAGYPVGNSDALALSMKWVVELSNKARGVRVIACASLAMAWIARGRLSAYYSFDLHAWDVAAGSLLIQEAGGQVTGLDNQPYTLQTRDLLCSQGGSLHIEILKTLLLL